MFMVPFQKKRINFESRRIKPKKFLHSGEIEKSNYVNLYQAAIHYHLPYSSLYGRINRLKREQAAEWAAFRDYDLEPELDDNESNNGLEYRCHMT